MYPNAISLSYDDFYLDETYNNYRRLNLINLSDILNNYHQFTKKLYKEQTIIIKFIELGSYNYSIKEASQDNIHIDWNNPDFLNIYDTNIYELFINLNNSFVNNNFLLTIIFNDSYNLANLNELGEDNFCPELSIPIKEQIKKRAQVKINKKISKTYKCPKCEQYKVNVKSVQKRSLDENASEEILCLECGYFWINM